jgi:hypothetical protein
MHDGNHVEEEEEEDVDVDEAATDGASAASLDVSTCFSRNSSR